MFGRIVHEKTILNSLKVSNANVCSRNNIKGLILFVYYFIIAQAMADVEGRYGRCCNSRAKQV